MTKDTTPDLFIIESLRFEDEENRRLEGKILRDILTLSGRDVSYLYIRTEKELEVGLKQFFDSTKRYLHISCHGNRSTIRLTLDELRFIDFARIAKPRLDKRRLFFSACEVVNEDLASAILSGSECYSVIGPRKTIRFDDAVLMWASFYHLMFRDGEDGMKGGKIRWSLRRIRHAFQIEFDYFKPSGKSFVCVDINKK